VTIVVQLIVAALAVMITAYILPGVHVDGFLSALAAAVVLAIVNAIIRPILLIITIPISILTLGLFTLVVISFCVLLVAAIVPGFRVDGYLWGLAFAVVLALVNAGLELIAGKPV
jgi:putative membrane protein